MAVAQEDPVPQSGSLAEELIAEVRSEPALAWFLAQALWIAQPALEAFWPQEKITAIADTLESKLTSAIGDAPAKIPGESGRSK